MSLQGSIPGEIERWQAMAMIARIPNVPAAFVARAAALMSLSLPTQRAVWYSAGGGQQYAPSRADVQKSGALYARRLAWTMAVVAVAG
ncbi:MAG TPA: hypothetical protein VF116_16300 [Ktedonobacterales bacterium]